MTLANNHLNDFGEKPVNYTKKALDDVGIKSFGINFGKYDTPQVYSSNMKQSSAD